MAKAKQEADTQVTYTEVVTGYTLTITPEEAAAMLDVFHRVGGHPEMTRRGLIDNVASALRRAGAVYDGTAAEDLQLPGNNIYFKMAE